MNIFQEDIMNPNDEKNEERRAGDDEKMPTPANPEIDGKAELPDADRTDPAELSTIAEEMEESLEESRFGGEHAISPDHAEPTDVTKTTNDNYIDGQYIDVGGGD